MWRPRHSGIKGELIDSLIGEQCRVIGDIYFEGELHVDGCVQGNIYAHPNKEAIVIIGETGRVEGEVIAPVVVVNGAVAGDVHAKHKIHLGDTCKVDGTVHYGLIEMEVGAEINGALNKMHPEPPLPAEASAPTLMEADERPLLENQTKQLMARWFGKKTATSTVSEEEHV